MIVQTVVWVREDIAFYDTGIVPNQLFVIVQAVVWVHETIMMQELLASARVFVSSFAKVNRHITILLHTM